MCGCPKSAKVGTSHRLNYNPNGVGQGLAPAEVICGYMITNGCYQIEFNIVP